MIVVENIKVCFIPEPDFAKGYSEEPTEYWKSYGEKAYRTKVQALRQ